MIVEIEAFKSKETKMKLFTKEIREHLLKNGSNPGQDYKPVVKLFNPVGSATWLLTELDPEDPDIAFGLCDLGVGFPELGGVSISELENIKLPMGLSIERDTRFKANKTLSEYADEARANQRIMA